MSPQTLSFLLMFCLSLSESWPASQGLLSVSYDPWLYWL